MTPFALVVGLICYSVLSTAALAASCLSRQGAAPLAPDERRELRALKRIYDRPATADGLWLSGKVRELMDERDRLDQERDRVVRELSCARQRECASPRERRPAVLASTVVKVSSGAPQSWSSALRPRVCNSVSKTVAFELRFHRDPDGGNLAGAELA